jgi:hypothetical protein
MQWGKVLFRRTQRAFALIILLFRFSLRIRFFSHFPRICRVTVLPAITARRPSRLDSLRAFS